MTEHFPITTPEGRNRLNQIIAATVKWSVALVYALVGGFIGGLFVYVAITIILAIFGATQAASFVQVVVLAAAAVSAVLAARGYLRLKRQ